MDEIEILYEDNHLLVIDKPAGLLTQPSGTTRDNLEDRAKKTIKRRDQKPGNVFLEAIHRLDKPVSGIVIFAKTSKALSRLNESGRQHQIEKHYQAWVEGNIAKEEMRLEHYLLHDEHRARVVSKEEKNCKLAILELQVIERKGNNTHLAVTLKTGRYHQIRAQLSHIGHPIVGDVKYGAKEKWKGNGIALCHTKCILPHPVHRDRRTYASSLKR